VRHVISLARRVLEDLPHVLVVGDGAQRFARECGFADEDLLTDEARQVWKRGIDAQLGGAELPAQLAQLVKLAADPERAAGTVNIMARDSAGHIASAVSTSGWAWKYPGRLGDTPVIGAGNYADDRFGAAACTGFGELAIRASTARTIVAALEHGATVDVACRNAVLDLAHLGGVAPAEVIMSVVAIDCHGTPGAASTRPGTEYALRDDSLSAAELRPRQLIELG
jgi:beta-aspartyl-peptidase (threonine type)